VPPAERRAADKIASVRRRRAEQRMRIDKTRAPRSRSSSSRSNRRRLRSLSPTGTQSIGVDIGLRRDSGIPATRAFRPKPNVGAGSGTSPRSSRDDRQPATARRGRAARQSRVKLCRRIPTPTARSSTRLEGGQPASFQNRRRQGHRRHRWDQGLVGESRQHESARPFPTDLRLRGRRRRPRQARGPLRFVVDILSAT